jgi:hypothetical protein
MRFILSIALLICLIGWVGCNRADEPEEETFSVSGVYSGSIVMNRQSPMAIPPVDQWDTFLQETVTAVMVKSNALLIQLNPTSSQVLQVNDTLYVDPINNPVTFGADISFYRHIGDYAYYAYYYKAADSFHLHYFSTFSNARIDYSFRGKK